MISADRQAGDSVIAVMSMPVQGTWSCPMVADGWTEFFDELCAASADFALIWAQHQVEYSMPGVKTFKCFDVDVIDARTTSFTMPPTPRPG